MPKGRYIIDLDVVGDWSAFRDLSARLDVVEYGSAHWLIEEQKNAAIFGGLLLMALLYVPALVLYPMLVTRARMRTAQGWRFTEPGPCPPFKGGLTVPESVAECRRFYRRISAPVHHAPMRAPFQWPFLRPSWTAYVIMVVLLFLLVVNQFLWAGIRIVPKGLRVRLLRPNIKSEPSTVIAPILIYVRRTGPLSTAVLVNSREVAWKDLEAVLRRELLLRPLDWPIYVEGDRNMEAQWVFRAIDVVQGLHVPVVLLTR